MNLHEDYSYIENEDREIEIERYLGSGDHAAVPDRIYGKPVTRIRQHAFFAASDVIRITVPEGVRTIGEEAFAGCDSLERVVLPASLERLEKEVFLGSEKLREIAFPAGNPRYRIADGILYDAAERAIVLCPPGLEREAVSVPSGTKTVAAGAFYANRRLKMVQLPYTLKRIEANAFLFTNALPIISLPPYIAEIEPCAFLVGSGMFAEKQFAVYAFPNTVGYRYAVQNKIRVHPLYATVID